MCSTSNVKCPLVLYGKVLLLNHCIRVEDIVVQVTNVNFQRDNILNILLAFWCRLELRAIG